MNYLDLNLKNKFDPSINQGKFLINYNDSVAKSIDPYLDNLQITGIPGVNSVVEALDSQRPKTKAIKRKTDNVSKLEDKFNKVLVKYNETYKLFSESILNNDNRDKNIIKYFDKVVTTGDGNYSYINNYGYTHKFSTDAWSNRVLSCDSNPIDMTEVDYNKFKEGPDMGIHQPCGIAGTNVQNIKTKEFAWVDIKGYKHIYSDDLWKNKSEYCDVPVTKLSNSDYNSIPQGGNMTEVDNCLQIDINPRIWTELIKLNNQLLKLSDQISLELSKLVKTDVQLENALQASQNKIQNTMNQLNVQKKQINYYNNTAETISGEQQNTQLTKQMYSIHLLAWTFLLITILYLTLHAFMSPQSKTGNFIGLICLLILLFLITRWIWNKFTN